MSTAGILSLAALAVVVVEPLFARPAGPSPAAAVDHSPDGIRNSLAVVAEEP